MSRPIDRAVDIVAFCVIAATCAAGLIWARDVPYIVGLVVLGLSVEAWYVYRFIRSRRPSPRHVPGPDDHGAIRW